MAINMILMEANQSYDLMREYKTFRIFFNTRMLKKKLKEFVCLIKKYKEMKQIFEKISKGNVSFWKLNTQWDVFKSMWNKYFIRQKIKILNK